MRLQPNHPTLHRLVEWFLASDIYKQSQIEDLLQSDFSISHLSSFTEQNPPLTDRNHRFTDSGKNRLIVVVILNRNY